MHSGRAGREREATDGATCSECRPDADHGSDRTAATAPAALHNRDRRMRERPPRTSAPRRTAGHLRWDSIDARLRALREVWVATADVAGRPDSVPVWFWWEGTVLYFSTHPQSAKARNLARRPEIVVHNGDGADSIIIRGTAEPVRDAVPREVRRSPFRCGSTGARLRRDTGDGLARPSATDLRLELRRVRDADGLALRRRAVTTAGYARPSACNARRGSRRSRWCSRTCRTAAASASRGARRRHADA